jgi:hypothetical protein
MARAQQPAAHEGPLVCSLYYFPRVLTHALQYDRVDPTEFQSLKDEIENLKGEKSAWETERAAHTLHSTEQQEKVIITNLVLFAAET